MPWEWIGPYAIYHTDFKEIRIDANPHHDNWIVRSGDVFFEYAPTLEAAVKIANGWISAAQDELGERNRLELRHQEMVRELETFLRSQGKV